MAHGEHEVVVLVDEAVDVALEREPELVAVDVDARVHEVVLLGLVVVVAHGEEQGVVDVRDDAGPRRAGPVLPIFGFRVDRAARARVEAERAAHGLLVEADAGDLAAEVLVRDDGLEGRREPLEDALVLLVAERLLREAHVLAELHPQRRRRVLLVQVGVEHVQRHRVVVAHGVHVADDVAQVADEERHDDAAHEADDEAEHLLGDVRREEVALERAQGPGQRVDVLGPDAPVPEPREHRHRAVAVRAPILEAAALLVAVVERHRRDHADGAGRPVQQEEQDGDVLADGLLARAHRVPRGDARHDARLLEDPEHLHEAHHPDHLQEAAPRADELVR